MKTRAIVRLYRECVVEVEHDEHMAGLDVAALAVDQAPSSRSRLWGEPFIKCVDFEAGDFGDLQETQ